MIVTEQICISDGIVQYMVFSTSDLKHGNFFFSLSQIVMSSFVVVAQFHSSPMLETIKDCIPNNFLLL